MVVPPCGWQEFKTWKLEVRYGPVHFSVLLGYFGLCIFDGNFGCGWSESAAIKNRRCRFNDRRLDLEDCGRFGEL